MFDPKRFPRFRLSTAIFVVTGVAAILGSYVGHQRYQQKRYEALMAEIEDRMTFAAERLDGAEQVDPRNLRDLAVAVDLFGDAARIRPRNESTSNMRWKLGFVIRIFADLGGISADEEASLLGELDQVPVDSAS